VLLLETGQVNCDHQQVGRVASPLQEKINDDAPPCTRIKDLGLVLLRRQIEWSLNEDH
jgi:hypothetical protein